MLDQVRTLAEDIPTPDVPVPDDLMKYVYFGIAAFIVIGAVVAILKAVPKWVFVLGIIVIAVVTGYIKVK